MQQYLKRAGLIAASCLSFSSAAWAAGGQIISDITYNNPAAMVNVKNMKAELAYYLVSPVDVNSEGDFACTAIGAGPSVSALRGKVDSHTNYNLPYVNLVTRYGKWAFGVNLTQPFRTKLDYGTNSNCRYGATDVNILTYDVQPMVAYQATPTLALGFGANIQYLRVIYDAQVFLGGVAPQGDRVFKNKADDTNVGFDVGVYWTPRLGTIFSAAYFSEVHHLITGDSELVDVNKSTDAAARFDRPWMLRAGLFQALSRTAGLYAGYTYVNWKSFKKITVTGSALPAPQTNILFDFFYNDSHRIDFGGRFTSEDGCWIGNAVAYWQNTPTNGVYRNVFLPEGDRIGLALRLQRKITNCFSVRALWSHTFISDAHINTQNATMNVIQNGTMQARADTWGLGVVYES